MDYRTAFTKCNETDRQPTSPLFAFEDEDEIARTFCAALPLIHHSAFLGSYPAVLTLHFPKWDVLGDHLLLLEAGTAFENERCIDTRTRRLLSCGSVCACICVFIFAVLCKITSYS